ncbi:sensor domain-containing diguanylate cyclase [Mitsuaria sp. GD03876]|uniref:sensor domain-containing diguanylate cyclase n=1 Tax=Mitsuaria sp. GD03876 TaxID=2975399 RepID=UPI002449743C|nr:sensor domain-containing diguanylate cyclase [Mitsuaria sp. GD03876]MDH0867940.1 sensor domain-containing diguanylate cyclase [Mitsuaria sp. GD03876]
MRSSWSKPKASRRGADGPWLRPMLLAVLVLAVAAGWALWWTLHQVRVLGSPGADQDLWHAVNVQRELQKLQRAVDAPAGLPPQELALRLEVLVSLLRPDQDTPRNDMSPLLLSPPTRDRMARTGAEVLRWADRVRADERAAPSVATEIRREAPGMVDGADQAVVDLHLAITERSDAARLGLRHRFALLSWVLGGLVLAMLAMIAGLYAQARRTQRLAQHRGLLNRRLESRVQRRTRQLAEGKALLNFILDASPSEVAVLDAADGRVEFINQRFLDRLGQRAKVGQPLALREVFQAPAHGEHFATELEQFGRVDAVEAQFLDRAQDWVSLSAQLIEVEQGRLAHLVWCYDITTHKQLEDRLRAFAGTDVLSGLDNRRAFFDKGAQMLEQARRYGHPISLLMLDIDHFKRINDAHGHASGDEAIRRVAQLLRTVLREADLIARVGGEEFCALLPETALEPARDAAQRLIEQIRQADLGPTAGGALRATVSAGVAQLAWTAATDSQTLDQLMHLADQALYDAKAAGRDRVVVAPASLPPLPIPNHV